MKITKTGAILLLSLTILTSCEEKNFDVVLNLNFFHNYMINSNADISEEYSITKGEIDDEMDISETEGELDSIYISNLYATIKTLPGNTASQVTISGAGRYTAINNNEFFPLFNENTIALPEEEGDSIEVEILNLVSVGIKDLKYVLNNLVLNQDISDNEEVAIQIESQSIPSGSTVHAEITIHLQAMAVFEYKTELLSAGENESDLYEVIVAGLYEQ